MNQIDGIEKSLSEFQDKAKGELETVEVEDLIHSLEVLLKAELLKENIELSLDVEKGLKIRMDRKLIEQVLINLITNARHALENTENPSIQIKAYSDIRSKYITITDNGIGIEPSKQEQIFIPFFSTKEKGSITRPSSNMTKASQELKDVTPWL